MIHVYIHLNETLLLKNVIGAQHNVLEGLLFAEMQLNFIVLFLNSIMPAQVLILCQISASDLYFHYCVLVAVNVNVA